MKKILVQISRYMWWPLWVLQQASGLACLYLYFWDVTLLGAGGCLLLAFGFYLARVYLKGINRELFEKFYNVDQGVAPFMEGSKRRNLRRKNSRDKELNEIKKELEK